ncbi:hypothetical protein DOTSEDRAFT_53242 [Dothistroma septosporum NZE10]|uniref:Uncharacterized protein n=1 Tax=Dothistroma septosporum (strain NZE10 / CBS 128990) TaxID=675120 RepID=N1PNL3_DOTSN|nr:hypothetical protein DOTSEDRAFT_53242 [Dothistroma septosporum NZE10]
MATRINLFQRFTSRSATTTLTRPTTAPELYLDQFDHIAAIPLFNRDEEYSSRREALYRANMDYVAGAPAMDAATASVPDPGAFNDEASAAEASTPSRPDSGVLTRDDASSVYSTDYVEEVTEGAPSTWFRQEGCGVSGRFVHREAIHASRSYDVSDLQQAFGMSVTPAAAEATVQEVAPVEAQGAVHEAAPQLEPCQAGPSRPQAEDSSSLAPQEDNAVHEAPCPTKKSSKSNEGHGTENPDAVPTAGGIRLGSNAKNWGSWQERILKQAEEAGLLEQASEEAEKGEKDERSAIEHEELPRSKSTTSLLKRLKGMGLKRSKAK